MWENYQNKRCLKFVSGLQVTVIPNCFYCRMFLQYTGDAIVCIKVLKAPMFYMNHSRHYPCCVLQVTSPKVWDVQHPDIPHWTKGHEDLGMSNNIWLQYRIVPNRHIGTDSESSSRDDVKMDIVFVYAYYINVYIHDIHISYIADRYIYIMYVCSCRCNHPGVYRIFPHHLVFCDSSYILRFPF